MVYGLFPGQGAVGSSILVFGDGFSATPADNDVLLNGTPASVHFASRNILGVRVPTGASSGPLTVTVGGQPSNPATFTLLTTGAPTLSSIGPTDGAAGTPVVLQGTNLGDLSSTLFSGAGFGNAVYFDGIPARYAVFTPHAIYAVVPGGLTPGQVQVEAEVNGVRSNAIPFTVQAPRGPTLTSISPDQGPVGTQVTILGTDLIGSSGVVSFNGAPASLSDLIWVGQSSLVCLVPAGATSGPVTVTVDGQQSNGVTFTVTAASGAPAVTTVQARKQNRSYVTSERHRLVRFTIEGTGLGSSSSIADLFIDGQPAVQFFAGDPTILFSSDTRVEAQAYLREPDPIQPITGSLRLIVGGQASNDQPFSTN